MQEQHFNLKKNILKNTCNDNFFVCKSRKYSADHRFPSKRQYEYVHLTDATNDKQWEKSDTAIRGFTTFKWDTRVLGYHAPGIQAWRFEYDQGNTQGNI